MDDHFDIGRVFEIGKFDITRLTCIRDGTESKYPSIVFSEYSIRAEFGVPSLSYERI